MARYRTVLELTAQSLDLLYELERSTWILDALPDCDHTENSKEDLERLLYLLDIYREKSTAIRTELIENIEEIRQDAIPKSR